MPRQKAWVLNREAMSEFDRCLVTGLEALANEALARTKAPVAKAGEEDQYSPLSEQKGVISYLDGKRVGGDMSIKKPKDFTVRGKGASVGVGFGFPARFNEMGTAHQPARPFFTPPVMETVGNEGVVVGAMKAAFGKFLAKKSRMLK